MLKYEYCNGFEKKMLFSTCLTAFIVLSSWATGQACSFNEYDRCSLNNHCAWLPFGANAGGGICSYVGDSCYLKLLPCESDNFTCTQPNTICVKHSRCDERPVCYSMKLADPIICPPMTMTIRKQKENMFLE